MELSVPNPSHRILLDCQSFFNGVHYQSLVDGKWKDIWNIIIDGNDCESIAQFARSSIDEGKFFCLNANLEEHSIDISANQEQCL